VLGDADFLLALGDFQFGDAGLLHQVDELFQFAKIHARILNRYALMAQVFAPAPDVSGQILCLRQRGAARSRAPARSRWRPGR